MVKPPDLSFLVWQDKNLLGVLMEFSYNVLRRVRCYINDSVRDCVHVEVRMQDPSFLSSASDLSDIEVFVGTSCSFLSKVDDFFDEMIVSTQKQVSFSSYVFMSFSYRFLRQRRAALSTWI